MVAAAHDGHTYVWGIAKERMAFAPFTTKLIENRVYVDNILSSEMKRMGLKRGMELLKVNGKSIFEYAREEIEPYVSSSTEQWLKNQTYNGFNLLLKPEKQTVSIELKDGKKNIILQYENGMPELDLKKNHPVISYDLLPDNIGLLTIRNFSDSQIQSLFDQIYPSILKSDALLIDIRGNGGGNSNNADYILRHLSKDSIRSASWKSPMYVPAFASWGRPPQWYNGKQYKMPPIESKVIYEKPVAVLVDAGTFSAAEDFCGVFKGMKRGALIGSPTGGSTGNGVRIELIANTAWANICSKHDTAPDGTEFVGKGFIPDIQVIETYQSYFKDKTDACLSKAILHLKQKK